MSLLLPEIDNHVISSIELISRGLIRFAIFKLSPSLTEIVIEHPSPAQITVMDLISKRHLLNEGPIPPPSGDLLSSLSSDLFRRFLRFWNIRELRVLALTSRSWYQTLCQVNELWEECPFGHYGLEGTRWENITALLPPDQSRFALYFPTEEERLEKPPGSGPKDHRFVLLFWCPSTEKVKMRVVYTASVGHLKKFVKKHVSSGSVSPMEMDTIEPGLSDLREAIYGWYALDEFDDF